MNDNLKTIRELPDELGVSKQAIWKVGRHVKIHAVCSTDSIDLHRQQKQRRGEEIVNRPTQWVAVRCPITGCAVMKKYSMRTS